LAEVAGHTGIQKMIIDVIIPVSFICCRLHELVIPAKPVLSRVEGAGIQAFPAGILRNRRGICYLVPVAETVFVIPAEAGIQLFRSGPLLSQG